MSTDYMSLCEEIFGTADEVAIRQMAAKWKKGQTRNAGRKASLPDADKENINDMIRNGVAIQEIAAHFHVSRRVISEVVNHRPGENYTMRIPTVPAI